MVYLSNLELLKSLADFRFCSVHSGAEKASHLGDVLVLTYALEVGPRSTNVDRSSYTSQDMKDIVAAGNVSNNII